MKPVVTPIIKVVGDFCNLRCQYCFYNTRDQSVRFVMNDELLKKFINQYLELFTGNLVFVWHGGEPLLAGLRFFQNVIDFQKKYSHNSPITNVIQTNATLIDDEWAEFFKANNFRVGVSLDGDKESHDHFRINAAGQGSFDKTMAGIKRLREHGINPAIIQTITHNNIIRAQENLDFFVNILGAKKLLIGAYLDVQKINTAMADQNITNEELTKVLMACIDRWLVTDDSSLKMGEISHFIAGVLRTRASSCEFNGTCTNYICLEYDGRIYPCDRLSNRPELLLGNLAKQSLAEILNSSARSDYVKKVNTLHPDCVACEWRQACHNGCTMHRVDGIGGKYFYCATRKKIFSYLKGKLKGPIKF